MDHFDASEQTVRITLRVLEQTHLISITAGSRATVCATIRPGQQEAFIPKYLLRRINSCHDVFLFTKYIFSSMIVNICRQPDDQTIQSLVHFVQRHKFVLSAELLEFFMRIVRTSNNTLMLNLLLEVSLYYRYPYFIYNHRGVFGNPQKLKAVLASLVTQLQHKNWVRLTQDIQRIYHEFLLPIVRLVDQAVSGRNLPEQIPFRWHIYWDQQQRSYSIAAEIMQHIHLRLFTPGKYLPSYASLADKYRVSIGTIRKAMRLLHHLGVVQILNGQGTKVMPFKPIRISIQPFRPELEKNFLYYLQSLQVLALTSDSLALYVFPHLTLQQLEQLLLQIEQIIPTRSYSLLLNICLRVFIAACPSPCTAAIYERLAQLLTWGYPLSMFLSPMPKSCQKTIQDHIRQLLASFKQQNADGFAASFQDLCCIGMKNDQQQLLQFGIEDAKGFEAPAYHITDRQDA